MPDPNQNQSSSETLLDTENELLLDPIEDPDEEVVSDMADIAPKVEKKEDDKEDEEEPVEEIKLASEEDEETIETEDDLVTPVRRKEILKAYPDIFKKFPYIERAIYREREYSEILPTIEEARTAAQKAEALDTYQSQLAEGNFDSVLDAIKKTDERSFAKIVDNYLPNLQKVDPNAFLHVVGDMSKRIITSMAHEANSSKNEALMSAAQILNQFLFGTSQFTPSTTFSKEAPKDDKLQQERQQFVQEKYEFALNDLTTRTSNTLKKTIDSHIDPKNMMSPYIRKNAVRDCLEVTQQAIASDSKFQDTINKLWDQAFKENFSPKAMDRIKSAYLSKAKAVLPVTIKRIRNEAARGQNRTDREETRQDPLPIGRSAPNKNSGKITKPQDIPANMRTIDFLMKD